MMCFLAVFTMEKRLSILNKMTRMKAIKARGRSFRHVGEILIWNKIINGFYYVYAMHSECDCTPAGKVLTCPCRIFIGLCLRLVQVDLAA